MGCELSTLLDCTHFVAPNRLCAHARAAEIDFKGSTTASSSTLVPPMACIVGSGLVVRATLVSSDLPSTAAIHIDEAELVPDTTVVLHGCSLQRLHLRVSGCDSQLAFHVRVRVHYVV